MCRKQKEQVNGSDKMILLRLCRNKCVFIKELDIVNSEFKLSWIVTSQCCQEVQFSESSFMIKIKILAWNKNA